MVRFEADAASVVGKDAINAKKTVSGTNIDIIGMANDTNIAHTIGVSSTIFSKMVCATFVMVPMEVEIGDLVSVKILQKHRITGVAMLGCRPCHGSPTPPKMSPRQKCLHNNKKKAKSRYRNPQLSHDWWNVLR